MNMDKQVIAATVDALGLAKSQMAEMKAHEEALKADLIGVAAEQPGTASAFEGELFRATVSFGNRSTIAWRAVVEELAAKCGFLGADVEKLIAKHTETASNVPTVRVVARKA